MRALATFGFVALAAFLLSHVLTGMVSHALLPPLGQSGLTLQPRGPAAQAQDVRQFMREIEASRLFASAPVTAAAAAVAATGPGGQVIPAGMSPINASTKLRLLGTVVGDATQSLAIVEEIASKRQGFYRLHDQIPNVGELLGIKRDSILLGQGPLQEELFLDLLPKLPAPSVAATVPPGTVVAPANATSGTIHKAVDRAELNQMLSDIPALMMQARAMPWMNNGKMEGFKLDYITKGSFFEKLGLQAGDILQRINGVELRDPGMALSLFQQLRSERNVAVDVLRSNQRTTLAYDIRG